MTERKPQGTWGEPRYEFTLFDGNAVATYDGPLDKMMEAADALANVLGVPVAASAQVQCAASIYHGPGHQSWSRCELRAGHDVDGDEHEAQNGRIRWEDDE